MILTPSIKQNNKKKITYSCFARYFVLFLFPLFYTTVAFANNLVNYACRALITKKGQLRGTLHDILDINHRRMKHFTATKE